MAALLTSVSMRCQSVSRVRHPLTNRSAPYFGLASALADHQGRWTRHSLQRWRPSRGEVTRPLILGTTEGRHDRAIRCMNSHPGRLPWRAGIWDIGVVPAEGRYPRPKYALGPGLFRRARREAIGCRGRHTLARQVRACRLGGRGRSGAPARRAARQPTWPLRTPAGRRASTSGPAPRSSRWHRGSR